MKISDGMLQKLDKIEARYEEVGNLLSLPQNISDQEKFKSLSKEHSDLAPICEIYGVYKKHKQNFEDCESMAAAETDPDMKSLLKQELDDLREALDKDANDLKISLLPKDPDEDNNVIMEIRAGAGGDEAALFGTELMKMYRRKQPLESRGSQYELHRTRRRERTRVYDNGQGRIRQTQIRERRA